MVAQANRKLAEWPRVTSGKPLTARNSFPASLLSIAMESNSPVTVSCSPHANRGERVNGFRRTTRD